MRNDDFYTKLPTLNRRISELLLDTDAFHKVPTNWYIVNTDIKGSTILVNNGMSELVNLVATGSIIAVLNIAAEATIDIPFFFGGDGATLLVPPTLIGLIMPALFLHQSNVKKQFNIDLRVGKLLVAEVIEKGNELKIAKVGVNQLHVIPIILGNGLKYAENIIKAQTITPQNLLENTILNLEGMECSWDKIPPPNNAEEVVSLIVAVQEEKQQAVIFKKILEQIERIYGSNQNRNPVSIDKLSLNAGIPKIKTVLSLRNPNYSFLELIKLWLYSIMGKFFSGKTDQNDLKELVQLSDTFVMDGQMNMVISGTSKKRTQLVQVLDEMEKTKEIIYGIFVSNQSVMSCYVRDINAQHIHFIDGGNGGYTKAAVLLKEKMNLELT